MRRALLLFIPLVASCVAPSHAISVAPHAPRAPVPLEEYFKIRRVGSRGGILLSFSHDEAQVAYLSDEGGRADIWVQPIEGGPARQITHVQGFIQSLAFSPAADQLVFETDRGGDELPHLFLTDSRGAPPRDLTADYPPGRRTRFVEWADDGRTFLFLSNLRDERYLDLCEYDLASGRVERLWESSGAFEWAQASRDHRRFIVLENLSDANTNLYLVERGEKAAPTLLTPHSGEVLYASRGFSRDARTVFYTSDAEREFAALHAMDLTTRASKRIVESQWDVEGAGLTRGLHYFFHTTNVDGQARLVLEDATSHRPLSLPPPPQGGAWVPLTSSRTDRYLGVRLQSDVSPSAPYVIDLKAGSARRVIDPLPPSLSTRPMVVGTSERIPSFDGRPVPAFLYRPAGAGPFPAVIDVHGGPTSQSRRDFDAMRQYLVSKGYVVLVPNVRGSTGYGKTYMRLDNLDLGGGPLRDVVACKQWLVKQANVDATKVVVRGGSYGGYMALAAATFTPREFAASVDYFGVSDLKTLVESFPPYWAAFATTIYQKFGDPKNPEHARYQHDRSPVYFADRIERPLLIVQGDRDARVKKEQSDRIAAALKLREVPVHYLVFADEGHGFSKNENVLAASQATDRFLDRYILGDTSLDVLP